MKKVLLLFVTVLLAMASFAQEQVYDFYAASPNGQVLWYKINPDNVSVTLVSPLGEWPGYPNEDSKPAGNVIIPDTVYHGGNAYVVTALGNECFRLCGGITALHFPATLVSMDPSGDLLEMPGLIYITVDPDNPVYDSRNNCNALIHTATNRLELGCASTIIPDDITTIGVHAFYGNHGLTSITIPLSVTSIEYRAFRDCINLTSLTFQDNVGQGSGLNIGFQAFMGCYSLTSLYIPSRVMGIDVSAFGQCWSLASITVDPLNPSYDSRDNCNAIIVSNTNVLKVGCINTTIPTSVTKITPTACIGNHYDTNAHIVIPDWVTGFAPDNGIWVDYNTNAFASQYVADVTFPAGWENFDIVYSKWYNGEWNKLIFLGSTPPVLTIESGTPESQHWGDEEWDTWWYGQSAYIIPIEVPCGTLATWRSDPVWNYFPNMSEPNVPQLVVNAEHGSAEVVTYPTCGNNTATVSATATEEHYHFVRWSDGSTQNPYTLTLTGNTTLTAHFAIDSVTVSVATFDAGKGSVIGGGVVPFGGTATVTAVPSDNNIFLAWSNGVIANPYTLTVTSDTSLTAMFTIQDTLVLRDTTYVPVHDTTYIDVHDTTYVPIYAVEYVDHYIHDTAFVNSYVHDTTILYVNQYVHDTTIINTYFRDTTIQYVNQYVYDTALINIYVHDTTIQYVNQYVHDTTYINNYLHDTILQYVNQYVHDTTVINNYLHDTILMSTQMFDTTIVNSYQFDTAIYNSYNYDTIIVNTHYHDTVFVSLHDTIYVTEDGIGGADGMNAKIYSCQGQVVVEGANGNQVTLYDINGQILATRQDNYKPLRFDAPATGTYLIKIGNYPARKVVVVR